LSTSLFSYSFACLLYSVFSPAACLISDFNSGFKANILDFGGISNKIRKKYQGKRI